MKCTGRLCGIDSETTLIQNRYEWPDVVVAGFCSKGFVDIVEYKYLEEYQRRFLDLNKNTKFVFFNAAFDINVMGRDIWLEELKKEGRIMELKTNYQICKIGSVGWIPPAVTLYSVAKDALKVELNKEDGTRTSFSRESPLSLEQILYLVEDCAATEMCGYAYNNVPTETLQAQASFVLSEISHNGIYADREYIESKRKELMDEMQKLTVKLRAFGFRVKRETDDMTQIDRFSRSCAMFGVPNVKESLERSEISSVPKPLLWILVANLISININGGINSSDIIKTITDILAPAFDPSFDLSSKNKTLKKMVENSQEYIKAYLNTFEVGDCISTKPKPEVALTILEVLAECYSGGLLRDGLGFFNTEFQQRYDENLGWLAGTKPISPTAFIQDHLKRLLENNPELELPLTDSASDNITDYIKSCKKKGVEPDQEELKKLCKYACRRQEMWRLTDLNIQDTFLDIYTKFKHAEKLLSTYFTTEYIEGDGRVHSKFKDFLNTGRTASSSPNIQNLPREDGLREQYIATPGNVFCACDYSQEELVTLAATLKRRFGNSRMADAVNAGLCLHSFFAGHRDHLFDDIDITNLNDEKTVAIIKERTKNYKEDEILSVHRQQAKMANFGLGSNMSTKTFYLNCRNQEAVMTLEEVDKLRSDWFEMWPEMKLYVEPEVDCEVDDDYFDKNKKKKKRKEDNEEEEESLTLDEAVSMAEKKKIRLYRTKNVVGMWKVKGSAQAVLNFNFQSLAAVISKRALWLVFLDSLKFGYKLVNFIHDEIIVEVAEEKAAEVAERMQKLMLQAGKDILPDMLMSAEYALMRRWSKKAKAKYNKDGKLIPFEDA